jgi:hypothetical protein
MPIRNSLVVSSTLLFYFGLAIALEQPAGFIVRRYLCADCASLPDFC